MPGPGGSPGGTWKRRTLQRLPSRAFLELSAGGQRPSARSPLKGPPAGFQTQASWRGWDRLVLRASQIEPERTSLKSAVSIHSGERTGVSRGQTAYSVVPAVEVASARQCELQPLLACRLLPWTRSRGTPTQTPSPQLFGSRSFATAWWHVHRPSAVLLYDVRESRERPPQ